MRCRSFLVGMLCGAAAASIIALAARRAEQPLAQVSQLRIAGVTASRPARPLQPQFQLPDLDGRSYTIIPSNPALAPQSAGPPGSISRQFNGQTYYITPIGPMALR